MSIQSRARILEDLTGAGAPFELELVDVGGRLQRSFRHAPRTLGELIAGNVSDLPFFVYEEERLTFVEAHSAAMRLAHWLAERCDVRPGDRVAIAMRNYPEWVLAFTAAVSIGAIVVAMNAHWQADEMLFALRDAGPKVLIADRQRLDYYVQAHDRPSLQAIAVRSPYLPDGTVAMDMVLAQASEASPLVSDIAPDDPATLFYTSGSTGRAKGVLSSHRAVISALLSSELDAAGAAIRWGLDPAPAAEQAAALLAVPLFHVTGAMSIFLRSYRAQQKIVSMYKWDAETAAALIERERVSSFTAPPTMTGDLLRVAENSGCDLRTLSSLGGGGAPRAPVQVAQMNAVFPGITTATGWGMTETNGIGTAIGGPDYLERPASAGRCSAVLELKVVDEAGEPLAPFGRGELLVRGTSLFSGYWKRPEIDAAVFDDGWFRTGDVAYLDEEGFLFIVDRIKDVIIRGGENIGCGNVEAVLAMHPKVREAAVYGLPDERLGEEVAAALYADPDLDADELRDFAGRHLARFEVPRFLRLSAEPLLRTASGKIDKRELRLIALAAMTA